jgi:hypothetical protein
VSLSTCPDCGTPISSEAVACPKCGRQAGRKRSAAIAAVVALVLGGLAAYIVHKETIGLGGATNRRAVHSGQKEQVAFFYDVRADCEIEGYPEITVVRRPSQGNVSTEQGKAYPRYTRDNIRFDCDRNLVGATLVFYQSKPRFRGHDSFTITVRFPDSVLWTESYIVEVL